MNHVMIDVETMSTQTNAALCAIGAVFFEPSTGEIGKSFYQLIDPSDSQIRGGHVSAVTAIWWMKQSAEARAEIIERSAQERTALLDLLCFLNHNATPDTLNVWAKGASFDFPILKSALERNNLPVNWKFWNERCLRTLLVMAPTIDYAPHRRTSTTHNALTDAVYQAEQACEIWRTLTAPHVENL